MSGSRSVRSIIVVKEALSALYGRFLVRLWVHPVVELDSFFALVDGQTSQDEVIPPSQLRIDPQELRTKREQAPAGGPIERRRHPPHLQPRASLQVMIQAVIWQAGAANSPAVPYSMRPSTRRD